MGQEVPKVCAADCGRELELIPPLHDAPGGAVDRQCSRNRWSVSSLTLPRVLNVFPLVTRSWVSQSSLATWVINATSLERTLWRNIRLVDYCTGVYGEIQVNMRSTIQST